MVAEDAGGEYGLVEVVVWCATPECTEEGVRRTALISDEPDAEIVCGACGELITHILGADPRLPEA